MRKYATSSLILLSEVSGELWVTFKELTPKQKFGTFIVALGTLSFIFKDFIWEMMMHNHWYIHFSH